MANPHDVLTGATVEATLAPSTGLAAMSLQSGLMLRRLHSL
jgi:hypothetical protein